MKLRKRVTVTHEEVWDKYGKMIMKVAHRLGKKFDMPYDELLSEGVLRVFKKLSRWDESRSSLCTYVYRLAYFGMLDYCIKPLREIPMDAYNPDEDTNPFIQKVTEPNWFQNFFSELTEETKQMVRIIFEAPEELYEAIKPNTPKTSQKALRNYMVDVIHWSFEDVDRAFKEVAECL